MTHGEIDTGREAYMNTPQKQAVKTAGQLRLALFELDKLAALTEEDEVVGGARAALLDLIDLVDDCAQPEE